MQSAFRNHSIAPSLRKKAVITLTKHFMRKFLLIGALAAFTLTSCDKDDTKPATGNDSKRLIKMTKEQNGITRVLNFTYTGDKLTSVVSTDGNEQTLFTYDAQGNVTKVEELEDNFKNIFTYTYNNGVPATATYKSWQLTGGEPDELIEDDVLTYTVEGGKVTGIHLDMTQDGSEADFVLTYNNGNLEKAESVTPGYEYLTTFAFGNKKTAFPTISKYILDPYGFSVVYASKHELLTVVYDLPGVILDRTETTQYTYDSKGYPLTSDDGDLKITYQYQ